MKKLKKQKHETIYSGEKRRYIISEVMNVLMDWRLSPFEFEGAVRAGLRSSLCLQGFAWDRSDAEATGIITACLIRLNAVRPTWDQGQKEYVNGREKCSWCGCSVPNDLLRGRDRHFGFCSDYCARHAIQERNLFSLRDYSSAYNDALFVLRRVNNDTVNCATCNAAFKPLAGRGLYCSLNCRPQSQHARLQKQCCNCGIKFRPHSNQANKGRFCSMKCRQEFGFTTSYERICMWCHVPFIGKVPTARCCGQSCAATYSGMKSGKRIPKRINPPVFDYYFKR